MSGENKPERTKLQFSLMALSILITFSVVGLIRFADRQDLNSHPFFVRTATTVDVVGYDLGHSFAFKECPTTEGAGGANTYAYVISAPCFKHVKQIDIGKPLRNDEAVLVEQLDTARRYTAANQVRPICIGVVNGNVEAVEVRVTADRHFLAATIRQLGEPIAYQEQPNETLRASNFYRAKGRLVSSDHIQLAERTSISKGVHSHIATDDILIAPTPKGESLVQNTWNTFRSACEVAY